MNEAGSLQIGKVCTWLPADFEHGTNVVGATAFGTFTGRLVSTPTRSRIGAMLSCLRFEVEEQADVYGREVLNGLVMKPRLYDHGTRSFIQPDACLLL